MPVILESVDWPAWLGEVETLPRRCFVRPLPGPPAAGQPDVNSVRNNGAALLDAVGDPSADPPSDAPAGANPA